MDILALRLGQEPGAYHAFVYGHRGCGKSTELTRLILKVAPQGDGPGYVGFRVSASNELPPGGFKPLDILLLIMARLAEEVDRRGNAPSEEVVARIWKWFSIEHQTATTNRAGSVSLSAGGGIDAKSIWASLIGLFGEIRGELKLATQETIERQAYSLRRLSTLIAVLNEFLVECERTLPTGQKWLLIFEDFDKIANHRVIDELFVDHGGAFQQLKVPAIFTIPASVAYAKNVSLPFEALPLYDTPVCDRAHQPISEGRLAMRTMLAKRVDLAKFADEHQLNRLIVASGGSPRDLFDMTSEAAESAILRHRDNIIQEDVSYAIARQRRQTYLRLGEDPFEDPKVTADQKLKKLAEIYQEPAKKGLPDHITYSLLSGRLLQEFNTDGWFGVPPLVVDILVEMGTLPTGTPGGPLPASV